MNARTDSPTPGGAPTTEDWPERNRDWLVQAMARLRARLQSPTTDADIADCLDEDFEACDPPALHRCARAFGLTPFERELLLLAAGIELDPGLRAAVSALNAGNSPRASFALALGLLTQPHWDALSPRSPLRHWQLVEPEADMPLTQAALRIDERVLHFITGVAADDPRLLGIARLLAAHPPAASASADAGLPDTIEASEPLVESIALALADAGERGPILLLHAEPPDRVMQRDIALAAVSRSARRALWIDARDLPRDPAELARAARRIDREAALGVALPVLALDESGGSDVQALALAGQLRSPLLWLGASNAALPALPEPRTVIRFELPPFDAERTRAALRARWRNASGTRDPAASLVLERAAAQFRLGPGALDTLEARLRSTSAPLREAAIWSAAREAARGGLDTLAQRVVTHARFDDLVLPPAQRTALQDIVDQLRHRERVHGDWGFAARHPRGQGLTALFAGESGTGKTLAAEAIANEVELDLYRIDLASLVSKYIGETEKNLRQLFDAAEASGAVLLFDEADALFGKRSEVKDSHDRYANIEVAYLLQRVESYRGLSILTTNMKSSLDRAFLRRLRFVVTFPFPDAAAREQIWRRQFPAEAPLGSIDFPALAQLHLAGGNIHGIALNAAFKAAARAASIDQADLVGAARAEFAKLERSFNEPAVRAAAAGVAK